ncbi:MCE family protein [candidate division WOR-3 bacterium]|nr:MCE family protein [candidate division WOR-3 bacterium]
MYKLKPILKGAMFWFVILIIALSTASCGFKRANFTILFKDASNLKKGAPVFLNETEIGKVTRIKLQDGETAVRVQISGEYKDRIKEKSSFYILGSEDGTHIQVMVLDESSPSLKSGSTVKGSSKSEYWMRKGTEKAKGWIKKGIEKTQEFFESDEWKEFKDKMKKKLKNATKKGEEELKKQLPELKEEAKELYQRAKEQSPEVAARAKVYIDSLFKEAEKGE